MTRIRQERSGLNQVMERLRSIAVKQSEGALIGSEDALVALLEASRTTIRQAARLLEREGLLRVRRGPQGGYFAGRPNIETVETAVGAYLQSIDLDLEEITQIASALWIEVVRKAARRSAALDPDVMHRLRGQLGRITAGCSFSDVLEVETLIRDTLLELTDRKYIALILRINIRYAMRISARAIESDHTVEHESFLTEWRDIKTVELSAISRGDETTAVMAAQHARKLWHDRLWPRSPDRAH